MSRSQFPRRTAAIALVAMLVAVSLFMILSPREEGFPEGDLPLFENESQLRNFLASHRAGTWDRIGLGDATGGNEDAHSSTNVQVAGVDEIDMVKNDGRRLYVGGNDKVTVIEASAEGDMRIASEISITDLTGGKNGYASVSGLFLYDDMLAVVISEYRSDGPSILGLRWDMSYPTDRAMTTCVLLDVADSGDPRVIFKSSMSGWFTTGRAIGGYVYLIGQESIWEGKQVSLPVIENDGRVQTVRATDIRFDPQAAELSSFLNIMVLDLNDRSSNFTTLLMGWSSVLYVSLQNMYITNVVYPGDSTGVSGEVMPLTNIVRLRVEGAGIVPDAKGQVPGFLHNQFSLDEHDGMLRVATCTAWTQGENRVYVLDEGLRTIGSLEGIAPGETIQSARFMGDTLYLVTFLNTDPLFVIDLSDPYHPRSLGELVVPGFSSYLHHIGNDLLAGVGVDNWTFKISLYDVSDQTSPREVETLMAPSDSWSEANWDHKAVLFDPGRSWMFVPFSHLDHDLGICEQVLWVISMAEDGLTTIAELSTGSCWSFVRCVLIEDTMFVVTSSQVTSYDMVGFLEVGNVVYGTNEIISGEDDTIGIEVER